MAIGLWSDEKTMRWYVGSQTLCLRMRRELCGEHRPTGAHDSSSLNSIMAEVLESVRKMDVRLHQQKRKREEKEKDVEK